jgi:DNA recombination protein RmuC
MLNLAIGFVSGILIGFLIFKVFSKNNFENKVLKKENERLAQENKRVEILIKEKAEINIKFENEKEKLKELEKTKKDFKEEMLSQFKNLSNEIIENQGKAFNEKQKENFEISLKPIIKEFNEKITNFNKDTNENKAEIKTQIETLLKQTTEIGGKADNLADALKNNKKQQGNWGEWTLENLFNSRGLEKGKDYFSLNEEDKGDYYSQQMLKDIDGNTIKDNEGNNCIADFILSLPDKKNVIIDSKVSLNNYQEYINAKAEDEKIKFINIYCDDIKKHIIELGKKEYYKLENSLDFVFMYLPLENAFLSAVHCDKKLYNLATENKVAMVTASSLTPVISMINKLWSVEKQGKNFKEIGRLANTIFEKAKFYEEHLKNIGKSIDKVKEEYEKTKTYLQDGNANVLKTAEKIVGLVDKQKSNLLKNN